MYYLSREVFCCVDSGYVVLLDLQRDQYVCVERERLDLIAGELYGWPAPRHANEHGSAAGSILALLLQRELITADPVSGKPCEPTPDSLIPEQELSISEVEISRTPIRLMDIYYFFRSSLVAWWSLRFRSMSQVVSGVAECRAKRVARQRERTRAMQSSASIVKLFRRLRPLFPHDYLCLFESVALVQFLAHYGHAANWVFGVQVGPFAAHCWVQSGGTALNDTVDHLRSFTPIMVV